MSAPKPKPETPGQTRDYIVLRGRLEKAGKIYCTGATVPLTAAEAEHPFAHGIVALKADADTAAAGIEP